MRSTVPAAEAGREGGADCSGGPPSGYAGLALTREALKVGHGQGAGQRLGEHATRLALEHIDEGDAAVERREPFQLVSHVSYRRIDALLSEDLDRAGDGHEVGWCTIVTYMQRRCRSTASQREEPIADVPPGALGLEDISEMPARVQSTLS